MTYVRLEAELAKEVWEASDDDELPTDWVRDAVRLRLDLENDDELLEDI